MRYTVDIIQFREKVGAFYWASFLVSFSSLLGNLYGIVISCLASHIRLSISYTFSTINFRDYHFVNMGNKERDEVTGSKKGSIDDCDDIFS